MSSVSADHGRINFLYGQWLMIPFLMMITITWWLFAFAPLQGPDAEWLKRAQEVCFGMSPSGLPNGGGWILLIFAPVALLVSIFAISGQQIRIELQDTIYGKSRSRFLLIFACLLLAVFAWSGARIYTAIQTSVVTNDWMNVADGNLPEHYLRTYQDAPRFELIQESGRNVTLYDFKNKVTMVVFVFAHCPSVCPGLVHQSKNVLEQIVDPNFNVIYLTLDPERDTPSSLASMKRQWGLTDDRTTILSGTPQKVYEALDGFKVPHVKDLKTGDVTHPAMVAFLDQNTKIAYYFNKPKQQWLIDAANRLLSER